MQGLMREDPVCHNGGNLGLDLFQRAVHPLLNPALALRLSCFASLLIVTSIVFPSELALGQPSTYRRSSPNRSVRSVRDSLRIAQLEAQPATPPPGTDRANQAPPPGQTLLPGQTPTSPIAELPEAIPAESLPSGPDEYRIPLRPPNLENIRIKSSDGLISLTARDGNLGDIVTLLAETQGLNVVTADPLDVPITITLDRVTLDDALDAILSVAGYNWTLNKNIISITNMSGSGAISPQAQGLRLQVFNLDYAMARDVNTAITGMLSPLGNAFIMSSSDTETRQSREVVAVQDLPAYLDQIAEYIAQVDVPPRQVLIEVHILQVDLDAANKHGVNLQQLFHRNGMLLFEMHTAGFATPTPSQGFTFRFNDGNFGAFLEMLRTTTDAKTLASPRILAINGQLSRIQVGEQLGFRVTTTTETSTTQSVDFIDVGVVLEITPHISRDGKILLSVRPEVSSGRVNPDTGLPEEKTTELDTDVLLCDNEGIVIGGLLQEADTDTRQQLPWLGSLHVIGALFRRTEDTRSRKEIIMALIPRLVPYQAPYDQFSAEKLDQSTTRLLDGPLCEVPRPWEASHLEYHPGYWHGRAPDEQFEPAAQWGAGGDNSLGRGATFPQQQPRLNRPDSTRLPPVTPTTETTATTVISRLPPIR